MKTKRTLFDPKSFLAELGKGRTLASYRKNQPILAQGDPADALVYIQKGRVNSQGRIDLEYNATDRNALDAL